MSPISKFRISYKHAGLALCLGATAFMSLGCYGRFPLTNGIYDFNRNVSDDRYIRSIVFWPLSIVYVGAAIGDALIINVLEFWTGDRVVEAASLPDGSTMHIEAAGNNAPMHVRVERDGKVLTERQIFNKGAGKFEVRDASNNVLGTIERDANGKLNPLAL